MTPPQIAVSVPACPARGGDSLNPHGRNNMARGTIRRSTMSPSTHIQAADTVPRRWRRALRLATPTALVALTAALSAAPAQASHAQVGNATFPGSNYRCSDGQKTFLRAAWQEAYSYTKRAESLIDYIAAQASDDERRRLWEQDFRGYGDASDWRLTASPQRFFGAYSHARLKVVQSALDQARRRFEGKTMYLITCSTVCPKKTTSAHHIVVGRIVTCKEFWSRANEAGKTHAERLVPSARTLTHEVLHHIYVKVSGILSPVGDYHADGAGGHPDEKYYGVPDVTYLARNATGWAVRNNDTYAYFAREANREPAEHFTGAYADKEAGGTGALFRDMTWAQLNARKAEQAAGGQYLADVETYVRGGQRLYAGLWRIGTGDGVLTQADEAPFKANALATNREQDLIDVEIYRESGKWRFLGVYRTRTADAKGVGALQVGLSWNTLFARQGEYAKLGAYLGDVETYLSNGKRKYLGVWRVGPGAGAMIITPDAALFEKALNDRRPTQQLIDVERFVEGGKVWQIGVWRHADNGRGYAREPWNAFVTRWQTSAPTRTLIDIEEDSNVGIEY